MSSKVYIIKASVDDGQEVIPEKARKLFKAGGFSEYFNKNDFTAVKVHVGEGDNNTYVKAPYIKGLVDELIELNTKPFVTDTTTLYVGRRHNAIDHTALATEHGFSLNGLGIPFIVSDGLSGTAESVVKVNGEINEEVYIAYDIIRSQSILSVAHVTGHCAAGLGATLKTLGMGCASKKGKMKQHAALKLNISDDCTLCGVCYDMCPQDCFQFEGTKPPIVAYQKECWHCGACVIDCPVDAVHLELPESHLMTIMQKRGPFSSSCNLFSAS